MINKRNINEYKTALKLYKNGVSQKKISQRLNVTEKTVGVWLKDIKEAQELNEILIRKIENKMLKMLNVEQSTPTEINELTQAIKNLESRILK